MATKPDSKATNGKAGSRAGSGIKTIGLALQGGGSHGAFTWGVLDRLLEDDRLAIEGISGTSAGAVNAAILVQGFETGGRAGARATLDRFWGRMGEIGRFGPAQLSPWDRWLGHWNVDNSPLTFWVDMFSRLSSPYQFNPLNYNPLREVLQEMIELPLLRRADTIKLYVSATNVRSGKSRIFENKDMSIDALLASTCLRQIFQAVEIDGEAYWDGGYRGNPSLYPLSMAARRRIW